MPTEGSSSTEPQKNSRARELLKKNFPHTSYEKKSTSQSKSAVKSPAAQAQMKKILLMKMRQSARPGDPKMTSSSLSPSERHNVTVKLDETGAEKTFWFSKVRAIYLKSITHSPIGAQTVSIGKALDLLGGHFNIVRDDKKVRISNKVH